MPNVFPQHNLIMLACLRILEDNFSFQDALSIFFFRQYSPYNWFSVTSC